VFGGGGGGEMPFYVGCSADEGYVIEVDYLSKLDIYLAGSRGMLTLRINSNLGCKEC
jgi:hypothetical protein